MDFIIDSRVAVEARASTNIDLRDLKGLIKIKEEGRIRDFYLVCMEERTRKPASAPFVTIINWRDFLSRLWRHEVIPLK